MPHIHDQPGQVDFTVTLYLFRRRAGTIETMLHMHKKLGKLLPVGGHVELDETPWQAAAHELEEESGYELKNLKILQPKLRIKQLSRVTLHPQPIVLNTHQIPEAHFHSDIVYAFLVDGEPTKPLADNESNDIRWLGEDDFAGQSEHLFANTIEVCQFVMGSFDQWDKINASEYSLGKGE